MPFSCANTGDLFGKSLTAGLAPEPSFSDFEIGTLPSDWGVNDSHSTMVVSALGWLGAMRTILDVGDLGAFETSAGVTFFDGSKKFQFWKEDEV